MSESPRKPLASGHYKPHPDALDKDVGGERVLVSLATGEYYGLDPIGSAVWTWLSETGDLEAVAARLVEAYEVDALTARRDVEDLVRSLLEAELLVHEPGHEPGHEPAEG